MLLLDLVLRISFPCFGGVRVGIWYVFYVNKGGVMK